MVDKQHRLLFFVQNKRGMQLGKSVIYFGLLGLLLQSILSCTEPAVPEVKVVEKKVEIPESELTLLHRIQGRWIDNENPEAVIEVVGKKMLWVYQEEVLTEKEVIAYEELPSICVGTPAEGGMGFFVAYHHGTGYCYQIMNIKDNIFDYRPLGPVKDEY